MLDSIIIKWESQTKFKEDNSFCTIFFSFHPTQLSYFAEGLQVSNIQPWPDMIIWRALILFSNHSQWCCLMFRNDHVSLDHLRQHERFIPSALPLSQRTVLALVLPTRSTHPEPIKSICLYLPTLTPSYQRFLLLSQTTPACVNHVLMLPNICEVKLYCQSVKKKVAGGPRSRSKFQPWNESAGKRKPLTTGSVCVTFRSMDYSFCSCWFACHSSAY